MEDDRQSVGSIDLYDDDQELDLDSTQALDVSQILGSTQADVGLVGADETLSVEDEERLLTSPLEDVSPDVRHLIDRFEETSLQDITRPSSRLFRVIARECKGDMHRALYVQELKQKLILLGHQVTPGVTDLIDSTAGRLVKAIMTFEEETMDTDDENLDVVKQVALEENRRETRASCRTVKVETGSSKAGASGKGVKGRKARSECSGAAGESSKAQDKVIHSQSSTSRPQIGKRQHRNQSGQSQDPPTKKRLTESDTQARLDSMDQAIRQLNDQLSKLISERTQTARRQVSFSDEGDHAYNRKSILRTSTPIKTAVRTTVEMSDSTVASKAVGQQVAGSKNVAQANVLSLSVSGGRVDRSTMEGQSSSSGASSCEARVEPRVGQPVGEPSSARGRQVVAAKSFEVIRYCGPDDVFSNFHPSEFVFQGWNFNCVEQAYQAKKADDFQDYELRDKILRMSAPGAMRRATQHLSSERWDGKKLDVMGNIIRARARVDVEFRTRLVNTGSALLVENVKHPPTSFWAVGDGRGQNQMGRLLMAVRRQLQKADADAVGGRPRNEGDPATLSDKDVFLVLGDSMVADRDVRQGLQDRLGDRWQVVSFAWRGGTIPGITQAVPYWGEQGRREKVKGILIHAGTNDLSGEPTAEEASCVTGRGVQLFLEAARVFPNAHLYISGILPRAPRRGGNRALWRAIKGIRDDWCHFARGKGWTVVSQEGFWDFVDGEHRPDLGALADGLHLNRSGITTFVQNVVRAVREAE